MTQESVKDADLDVSPWIEPVQLVDELQHRPLDFIVTASAVIEPSSAYSVDLVEEDQTRFLRPDVRVRYQEVG